MSASALTSNGGFPCRVLCRQEGMPFFIRWIVGYQVSQYKKKVWQPFERECLQASASA